MTERPECKSAGKILVADDEVPFGEAFCRQLRSWGYETTQATTPSKVTEYLSGGDFDLVTLDLHWPAFGVSGIQLLATIQATDQLVPVIMITSDASPANAVEATRRGAFDYLEKVADQDRTHLTIRNAIESGRLNRAARSAVEDRLREYEIIGASKGIEEVRAAIVDYADSDVPVLICGETGSGKELVARQLHIRSSRASRTFTSITVATLTAELGADALFGHTQGAYTGSSAGRRGLLGSAHGGTLCLDDIDTMALTVQPLLLRFIETGEYFSLGADEGLKANVRILVTTNRSLPKLIEEGKFRQDLYYRLKVAEITVPPLRDRREDIPILVSHFIRKHSARRLQGEVTLEPECVGPLIDYDWPGNVRQLENTIISLFLSHKIADPITVDEVVAKLNDDTPKELIKLGDLRSMEAAFRRLCLIRALSSTSGNVSRAADLLGIERTHLHRLINEFDLGQFVKQRPV
jgi:DNA-binding NtrC family response regulator